MALAKYCRYVSIALVMCAAMVLCRSVASAQDVHSRWFLPGAAIVKGVGTGKNDVTITVNYDPAENVELFRYYINSNDDVLENLQAVTTPYEFTLTPNSPVKPVPDLDVTFSMGIEGKYACVYATGTNRHSISTWRVRRSIIEDKLNRCEEFFSAFAGSPSSCQEVENCVPSAECLVNGGKCDIANCCSRHKVQPNNRDHCYDIGSLRANDDPVDLAALYRAGGDIIPDACWEFTDPPGSNISVAYPKYSPMLGMVAYCIEEALTNLFYNGGNEPTAFQTILSKIQNFVRAMIALGIIVYAYNFIVGTVDKNLPGKKSRAWMFMKLALVMHFAVGNGLATVYVDLWPSAKGLAALILLSASDYDQVTGGTPAVGDTTDPIDNSDLLAAAENYSDMLRAANAAIAYHREQSRKFDELKQRLTTDCPNLSPYANRGKLVDGRPWNSGPVPSIVAQELNAAQSAVDDLFHCNVERSCDLVASTDSSGNRKYSWKAVEADIQKLYSSVTLPEPLKDSTCETSVLRKALPGNVLKSEPVQNALGGVVGDAYRHLKRQAAKLFNEYSAYFDQAMRIKNHNTLVYYYKKAVEGDNEIEVVKTELDILNNQILTAERRLTEIQAILAGIQPNNNQVATCVANDPTAQADLDQRTQLEAQIQTLQNDVTLREGALQTALNATPPNAENVTAIGSQITDLNNQLTAATTQLGQIMLDLEAKGCITPNGAQQDLTVLTDRETQLREDLAVLRAQKQGATSQDLTVQLQYSTLLTRLEARLAAIHQTDPAYYRELYCALAVIDVDGNGNLIGGNDFGDCPLATSNTRPICMDTHLLLSYSAPALLDPAGQYFNVVMDLRTQCAALDNAGVGIGEGMPADNSTLEQERSRILSDFFEVVPFVMEGMYSSADRVCMLGGKVLDISEVAVTLPRDDELLDGEQLSISSNDGTSYNASDAPSQANPYVGMGVGNVPIRHMYSNRNIFRSGGILQSGTLPDREILEDCDGRLDDAMRDYCVQLFGEEVGGAAGTYSYSGVAFGGFEEYGVHGCEYYLPNLQQNVQEIGLLDLTAEIDLLCPERDSQDVPVTKVRAWNFPEKSLREGGLLDGTQRKYYTCASGDALKNATVGIPAAYMRLVELFGANESTSVQSFGQKSNSFCACAKTADSSSDQCIGRLINVSGSDDAKGEVHVVLEKLLGLEYQKVREQFNVSPAGVTAGGGDPSEIREHPIGIYPYCNAIAPSQEDPFFLLWDILDCKFQKYLGFGAKHTDAVTQNMPKLFLISLFGLTPLFFITIPFGLIIMTMIAICVLRMAHLYIIAMMGLAVWLFIGPLIIPLVFFSETKGIFDTWFKRVIGLFIQPVLLALVFLYYFMIMDMGYFGANQDFDANNDIVASCDGEFCDKYTLAHAVQESTIHWVIIPFVKFASSAHGIGLDLVVGALRMFMAMVGIFIIAPIFESLINSVSGVGGGLGAETRLSNPAAAAKMAVSGSKKLAKATAIGAGLVGKGLVKSSKGAGMATKGAKKMARSKGGSVRRGLARTTVSTLFETSDTVNILHSLFKRR